MSSANFKPKRTAAASRGFLAKSCDSTAFLLKEGVVCIFQHVILERKGGEVVDGELGGGNYVWMDESAFS